MSEALEALEKIEKFIGSGGCLHRFGHDPICKSDTQTIRAALHAKRGFIRSCKCHDTGDGWKDLDQWHDDDGTCIFMFFQWDNDHKVWDFYDVSCTSPLTSDWPNTQKGHWFIKWHRISNTNFDLPTPPKGQDNE